MIIKLAVAFVLLSSGICAADGTDADFAKTKNQNGFFIVYKDKTVFVQSDENGKIINETSFSSDVTPDKIKSVSKNKAILDHHYFTFDNLEGVDVDLAEYYEHQCVDLQGSASMFMPTGGTDKGGVDLDYQSIKPHKESLVWGYVPLAYDVESKKIKGGQRASSSDQELNKQIGILAKADKNAGELTIYGDCAVWQWANSPNYLVFRNRGASLVQSTMKSTNHSVVEKKDVSYLTESSKHCVKSGEEKVKLQILAYIQSWNKDHPASHTPPSFVEGAPK